LEFGKIPRKKVNVGFRYLKQNYRSAIALTKPSTTPDQTSNEAYAYGAPLPKYESGHFLRCDTAGNRRIWAKLDDALNLELWNLLQGIV
jgi:hypothetical protein